MSSEHVNEEAAVGVGSLLAEKYRLRRLLGAGGMGSVYEAVNEWTGRRVAVKVMHRETARNQEAVARFMREARAATTVAHPNIIEVLDLGMDPVHRWIFLVTEFLDGTDLRHMLRTEKKLSPQRALELLFPVMAALVAVHRHGIVHRDIKPENIFVVTDQEGRPCPKLIDFGIAKIKEHQTQALTRMGAVMGTPRYMSPEQARATEQIDSRTDVWAIAIVLFELVAGRTPLQGEHAMQILSKLLLEPLPSLAAIAPDLPPALLNVLTQALERDVSKRIPSMSKLCFLLIETAEYLGTEWQETSRRWFQRQIATVDNEVLPVREITEENHLTAPTAQAYPRAPELASGWQLSAPSLHIEKKPSVPPPSALSTLDPLPPPPPAQSGVPTEVRPSQRPRVPPTRPASDAVSPQGIAVPGAPTLEPTVRPSTHGSSPLPSSKGEQSLSKILGGALLVFGLLFGIFAGWKLARRSAARNTVVEPLSPIPNTVVSVPPVVVVARDAHVDALAVDASVPSLAARTTNTLPRQRTNPPVPVRPVRNASPLPDVVSVPPVTTTNTVDAGAGRMTIRRDYEE